MPLTVLIRGAGDIASGIALRLYHTGMRVAMTEIAKPTTIRRTVAFSEAVISGRQTVEDVTAQHAENHEEALSLMEQGIIPVLVDPEGLIRKALSPDAEVDAILAKRNLGTRIDDAPVVVGVGPGFTAGADCHAVVETMRGHTLGRVFYTGSALPNTNIPGLIGGFAGERVIRAPAEGIFHGIRQIGDMAGESETVGYVGEIPVKTTIAGMLRGLLADGISVTKGMKSGDVDPRGKKEYCYLVSDKALAVAGGVLEAILCLSERF